MRISSALTTRLGAVATSVSIPLISAATLSGIISLPAGVPVFCEMRSTMGIKIATTPVELMTAPRPPTTSISSTSSFVSLLPARAISQSPRRCATPVRTRPSPMTNRAAISTMLGSAKPLIASLMLIAPVKGSSAIMIRATASMRGLLAANITTAETSSSSTTISWPFTGTPPP